MPKKSPAPTPATRRERSLEKTFEPASFEARWYGIWEREGRFQPAGDPKAPAFVMVIPPPNVTGRLHIGHAFGRTLEDILARWKRMRGYRTLWVPGTDHAGIATQMVVERELAKEGLDRRAMGREAFIERVWTWKKQQGNVILDQLRRLGCSVDWSRLRFTLDPELSEAVRTAFVRLYADGLIYQGFRVVNWCPRCGTAVSDLEVEREDTEGTIWKIRYDVSGVSSGAVVATTRPETMLGDTALAIHPEDPKTAKLRGKTAVLPIVGRTLPVIEDPVLVDKEFGTGVVKVTPAHDANDFASGQRHKLDTVVVIGPDAKMTDAAGEEFAGLDRFEARKKVLARLQAEGRVVSAEPHALALGKCQRCGTVIEPYLSKQWFVKIAPLAEPAIAAVEKGDVRFVPEMWTKNYFGWMREIHDWCISRQLWWGHRIPAFTCANGHVTVSETDPTACATCGNKELVQDPDVLDTWFSSQLWPFSVFGWPKETADLKAFYPTSTLVTAWDILFFWVARMIMAGLHFTGKAPFTDVHIHGLVRDEHGQKMSKTKGNVIDPLEAIDEFGADAVRFALAIFASPGANIPLARSRIRDYRAFATKLWNATRFTIEKLDGGPRAESLEGRPLRLPERWILSRLHGTAIEVNRQLEAFRFDEAAQALYAFLWHELCDGYLEMSKPVLSGREGTDEDRETVRAVLDETLRDALALLHPFMPFITEEIWEKLTDAPGTLIVAKYPLGRTDRRDGEAEKAISALRAILTRVRNFRSERAAGPTEPVELRIDPKSPEAAVISRLEELSALLTAMGRLSALSFSSEARGGAQDVVEGVALEMSFPKKAAGADKVAISRKLADVDEEISSVGAKLRNSQFLEKAPPEIVEKMRRRLLELEERRAALGSGL